MRDDRFYIASQTLAMLDPPCWLVVQLLILWIFLKHVQPVNDEL